MHKHVKHWNFIFFVDKMEWKSGACGIMSGINDALYLLHASDFSLQAAVMTQCRLQITEELMVVLTKVQESLPFFHILWHFSD